MGFGNFDSQTHGQVLFVPIDHGATRIGYVLSAELFNKYGREMTREQAVHEAKLAVAPFELEFVEVYWHTVYGIQQRVAESFIKDRIILAGDAAHTHSSGAAQGMNTGIHDVANLSWRLAGVIQGYFKPEVLQNYSDERRATAQHLIEIDKTISQLIYGIKPDSLKDRPEDTATLVREVFIGAGDFPNGFITCEANLLNDKEHSLPAISTPPGHRADDMPLRKPGLGTFVTSTRLYELTRFDGRFKILVFAGQPSLTRGVLHSLRAQVDGHGGSVSRVADYLTIIGGGFSGAIDEYLGLRKFGKGYWDVDFTAHWRYGVMEQQGALVLLRPEGIVGTSAALDAFLEVVVPYFERLLDPYLAEKPVVDHRSAGIGELNIANENSLESRGIEIITSKP